MLVTTDELATYMDVTRFTNRQEEAAELVLAGLQSELETLLRRPIEPVEDEVEYHTIPEDYLASRALYSALSDDFLPTPAPPYTLSLRNGPVTVVTSVRFKPSPSIKDTDPWYSLVNGTDYTIRRWGLDLYRVAANDLVEVTYTGGLDGQAIPVLKISILRAAAREMTNQVDDVVGLKDLQTNDVPRKQTGFMEEEIKMLQRWKRKQPVG